MVRWIYVRSFAPSEFSMSRRIASSSTESASTSAAPRWAYSLTSVMAISSHWTIDGVSARGNDSVVGAGVPVTVHFGRVRIVNFLPKITEVPGGERSLSRRRRGGQRFRAGWVVNHGQCTDG